jgi:prepilin signal peptidase PulO-like enzyme (type II secretory pathway)
VTRARGAIAIGISAIVVLATVLRVIGLKFGLPAVYNPDEVAIMSRALAFATGDLNPHNFLYPTFYFYALFAWIGASFVVSWIAGLVPSVAAFQTQFFTDPTNIYLVGRLLGVVCGVMTVALTYMMGTRLAGPRAGIAAALFLAVAPTHVRDSHYVKHDVPVTLAIALAQLAILRVLTQPIDRNLRAAILAGAACGIAFSTHYYAVFLTLPLVLAIVVREWDRERATDRAHATGHEQAPNREHASDRERASDIEGAWPAAIMPTLAPILAAGATAAVVFFALSPFILVEPRTALNDIVANRQIVVDRAATVGHGLFANAGAYARMLWTEAIGWPVLLASIAGGVLLARQQPRHAVVLFAFPVAFLLFISNTVAASRYLNPVLPTIAVLAGYAVARLAERRPGAIGPAVATTAAFWALVAAMSVPGLLLSLRLDFFFRQTDTRTMAQRLIEQDVPPGSTVLLQPYSVPLTQSRESLVEALESHLGDVRRASTKFARRLALDPYPAPAYRTLFLGEGGLDADKIYLSYADVSGPDGLAALRRAGVQYVVLKRYNVDDPAVAPLRQLLRREGRLLTTVSPYADRVDAAARTRVAPFLHNTDTPYDPALERPGPGIDVWQVR